MNNAFQFTGHNNGWIDWLTGCSIMGCMSDDIIYDRMPDTASQNAQEGPDANTPLDYLLAVVRDRGETPARRMAAADKAAPYVHPKLTHTVVEDRGAMAIGKVLADMLACRERLVSQGVITLADDSEATVRASLWQGEAS